MPVKVETHAVKRNWILFQVVKTELLDEATNCEAGQLGLQHRTQAIRECAKVRVS